METNYKVKNCRRCGRRHLPFEKKTEILGYHEGRPIIKAYPSQDESEYLTFWCEYCNREHLHGYGNGHRVAHCAISNRKAIESPYRDTGYYLNEV
jgi:hypothetical protein